MEEKLRPGVFSSYTAGSSAMARQPGGGTDCPRRDRSGHPGVGD